MSLASSKPTFSKNFSRSPILPYLHSPDRIVSIISFSASKMLVNEFNIIKITNFSYFLFLKTVFLYLQCLWHHQSQHSPSPFQVVQLIYISVFLI